MMFAFRHKMNLYVSGGGFLSTRTRLSCFILSFKGVSAQALRDILVLEMLEPFKIHNFASQQMFKLTMAFYSGIRIVGQESNIGRIGEVNATGRNLAVSWR
jgi:hypothetical protein